MEMLLLLPKELLIYILSLVVNDVWTEIYAAATTASIGEFKFYCCYKLSSMAETMQTLSLVHPAIRQTLRKATKTYDIECWQFRESFLLTLTENF